MAISFFVKVLVFLSAFFALIPNLVWGAAALVGRIAGHAVRYAPFGWTAFALVMLLWAVMLWGFFVGRYKMEVVRETVASPVLPKSFEDYRIAHISDLHLSTFDGHADYLERIVDSINSLHPDLICFTGDLVSLNPEEAKPYADILKRLHAPDGVVSVLGNHDFFIYSRHLSMQQKNAQTEELGRFQRDVLGWRLLRNSRLSISRGADTIEIIGVDNTHGKGQGFHTIDRGDLAKALQGIGAGRYSILLSHDPSHWRAEVLGKAPIALTLSGHTHAAQIRLFGWSPAAWAFKENDGHYAQGGQHINVNAGLGCTIPMRVACPSQITLITLTR